MRYPVGFLKNAAMTRNELAEANMRFVLQCICGEHSNDFTNKDLLNIVNAAKSLTQSRYIDSEIGLICDLIAVLCGQKNDSPNAPKTLEELQEKVRSIVDTIHGDL